MPRLPLFLTVFLICSPAAFADGHLTSDREVGCLDVVAITSDMTPPDLMNGVYACVAEDDYDRAIGLFFTSLARARFDEERVVDESAHAALSALQGTVRSALDSDQQGALMASYSAARSDLATACAPIVALGVPAHDPAWMLAHGEAPELGLVADFDADAAWDMGLQFLVCPR
ncbi:hypothetical protein [Pontivivens insulae]|uniref:DUF732 domain-containing protein n=1 Tax=Pontivivens insulae TaxID=1639689 RepID=A0A2R8AEQ3_9RHOB|nr:hypothetical protein [Pontivivens insulae]RED11968.1 hypothetical protein DFR53_2680 [Pontivivens insulae]SPF30724.1 hypothetical protein POI8812_03066 [Pontivivens insulae]